MSLTEVIATRAVDMASRALNSSPWPERHVVGGPELAPTSVVGSAGMSAASSGNAAMASARSAVNQAVRHRSGQADN